MQTVNPKQEVIKAIQELRGGVVLNHEARGWIKAGSVN